MQGEIRKKTKGTYDMDEGVLSLCDIDVVTAVSVLDSLTDITGNGISIDFKEKKNG